VVPPRCVLQALIPFALHGLAREVDAALGVLLHTTLDLPGFVGEALSLLDPMQVLGRVLAWTAAGAVAWAVLAAERGRRESRSFAEALSEEAGSFGPLLLRPAITALALVSLALLPTFPYGFTLPVALTQDWGIAQDVVAVSVLLALRLPPLRLPAPSTGGVFFLAFLCYAFLSPSWSRQWESHPGNQPKTMRTAVALAHGLTLDAEGVTGPMEELAPRPLLAAARDAAGTLVGESWLMLKAATRGFEAVGAKAIRATRITRQTIRGKNGGVFYVLPPGPSLLLAPVLRVDRALNRVQGTTGRLAVTLLFWNAMAAALVAAVFVLAREVSGRPGIAAAVTGFFALAPPYLFYFYQFYPEMLGGLVLALAFRQMFFDRRWTTWRLLVLGLLLASLPWLHQKFLVVWPALVVMAVVMAVGRLVTFRALMALVLPQAASLFLTALWNFAITGSVRPDALFLAWGPRGVTAVRIHEGVLGLLLDARYGIFPYAPVYLLAAAGLMLPGRASSRLRLALPAVAAYYVTVAAANNWAGTVSNLGRFLQPVTPLFVAATALILSRVGLRRGVVALALSLAGWSALVASSLWQDPHAADDCARLLAKSVFADGHVYIPNIHHTSWNYAAAGHGVRIGVWLLLAVATALWLRRVALGRGGRSPRRVLVGLAIAVLASAATLERWPSPYAGPRFNDRVDLRPGTTVFVAGAASLVDGDVVRSSGGEVRLLIRSRDAVEALRLEVWGEGALWLPGGRRLFLPSSGARLEVGLERLRDLVGRRGMRESLSRLRLRVETPSEVYLRLSSE